MLLSLIYLWKRPFIDQNPLENIIGQHLMRIPNGNGMIESLSHEIRYCPEYIETGGSLLVIGLLVPKWLAEFCPKTKHKRLGIVGLSVFDDFATMIGVQ